MAKSFVLCVIALTSLAHSAAGWYSYAETSTFTKYTATTTTTETSTPSCFQVVATTSTITTLNQVPECDTTQPPTTAALLVTTGRKRKRDARLIEEGPLEGAEYEDFILPSKSSEVFDEFNVVENDVESAMSKNPRRGGRFIPMIRYLEKTTVTTSSIITSSANATSTATYQLFYCTPSGLTSTSACTSSIAYVNLVQCTETAQCAALTDTPICNTDTNRCVQCTEDTTCASITATPVCDTAANTCVECNNDSQCTASTNNICDVTNTCV